MCVCVCELIVRWVDDLCVCMYMRMSMIAIQIKKTEHRRQKPHQKWSLQCTTLYCWIFRSRVDFCTKSIVQYRAHRNCSIVQCIYCVSVYIYIYVVVLFRIQQIV